LGLGRPVLVLYGPVAACLAAGLGFGEMDWAERLAR
jgi:hypothetical protein